MAWFLVGIREYGPDPTVSEGVMLQGRLYGPYDDPEDAAAKIDPKMTFIAIPGRLVGAPLVPHFWCDVCKSFFPKDHAASHV